MKFLNVDELPIVHVIYGELRLEYTGVGDGGGNSAGCSGISGFSYFERRIVPEEFNSFYKITCFFKKVYLYLYQNLQYVKFRAVYHVKPASNQYLPRCAI
jgi:hypothetical protein